MENLLEALGLGLSRVLVALRYNDIDPFYKLLKEKNYSQIDFCVENIRKSLKEMEVINPKIPEQNNLIYSVLVNVDIKKVELFDNEINTLHTFLHLQKNQNYLSLEFAKFQYLIQKLEDPESEIKRPEDGPEVEESKIAVDTFFDSLVEYLESKEISKNTILNKEGVHLYLKNEKINSNFMNLLVSAYTEIFDISDPRKVIFNYIHPKVKEFEEKNNIKIDNICFNTSKCFENLVCIEDLQITFGERSVIVKQ